jgi:uncharacterized protein YkwD
MKSSLFKAVIVIGFLFSIFSCSTNEELETANLNVVVSNFSYSNDETQVLELINNYRTSKGLNSLETVNHISHKSQEHNAYMITNNVVNHDLFDQRSNNIIEVLGAKRVGENVAYNFSTPESVLFAWLNSPSHKLNLDGDYTHVGISITINPANGNKYYTNMFMKK